MRPRAAQAEQIWKQVRQSDSFSPPPLPLSPPLLLALPPTPSGLYSSSEVSPSPRVGSLGLHFESNRSQNNDCVVKQQTYKTSSGAVVRACNPNTLETGVGLSSRTGLHSEMLPFPKADAPTGSCGKISGLILPAVILTTVVPVPVAWADTPLPSVGVNRNLPLLRNHGERRRKGNC